MHPHVGPQYVQMSWRNQGKHPPKQFTARKTPTRKCNGYLILSFEQDVPEGGRAPERGVRAMSRSISPPWGVNPISSGSPHVRPMGRTCGEPDEIKKNTHPKSFTALFREQVRHGVRPRAQRLCRRGPGKGGGQHEHRRPRPRTCVPELGGARHDGRLSQGMRSALRAVKFRLDGGPFDFVWVPARTLHVGPQYVWCLTA